MVMMVDTSVMTLCILWKNAPCFREGQRVEQYAWARSKNVQFSLYRKPIVPFRCRAGTRKNEGIMLFSPLNLFVRANQGAI